MNHNQFDYQSVNYSSPKMNAIKVLFAVALIAGALAAPASDEQKESVDSPAVDETSDSTKDLQTAEGHLGAYGGYGHGHGYGHHGVGYGGLGYGHGIGYGAGYGGHGLGYGRGYGAGYGYGHHGAYGAGYGSGYGHNHASSGYTSINKVISHGSKSHSNAHAHGYGHGIGHGHGHHGYGHGLAY